MPATTVAAPQLHGAVVALAVHVLLCCDERDRAGAALVELVVSGRQSQRSACCSKKPVQNRRVDRYICQGADKFPGSIREKNLAHRRARPRRAATGRRRPASFRIQPAGTGYAS